MAAACEREREPEPRAPENGFVSQEQHALLSRVDGCVLPFLGGFGAYQKRLVALTWIPAVFIGFSHFSDYFLLAQPNSTCLEAVNGTLNWTSPPPFLQQDNNYSGSAPDQIYELQTGLVQNVVTKVGERARARFHTHAHTGWCARALQNHRIAEREECESSAARAADEARASPRQRGASSGVGLRNVQGVPA